MATATHPTPEQLKAYADQLPPIYRDVLTALQRAVPERTFGGGVPYPYLTLALQSAPGPRYSADAVWAAVRQLEQHGFVTDDESAGLAVPTPVGEELLAALTGKRAERVIDIPPLPKPNW